MDRRNNLRYFDYSCRSSYNDHHYLHPKSKKNRGGALGSPRDIQVRQASKSGLPSRCENVYLAGQGPIPHPIILTFFWKGSVKMNQTHGNMPHQDPDGTRLPIKLDSTSNGEFTPVPLSPVNQAANRLAHEAATQNAKHLALSRENFSSPLAVRRPRFWRSTASTPQRARRADFSICCPKQRLNRNLRRPK